MSMSEQSKQDSSSPSSANSKISRAEFVAEVVKRATVAGAIAAAPMILESFTVPANATIISGTKKQTDI